MSNEERRVAIIRLLETMNDGLPIDPRGQWASFGAQPGERATERTPCRACDETGRVNTRKGDETCTTCGGKGFYLIDSYTGRRENESAKQETLAKMSSAERATWRLDIDGAISRASQQLSQPISERDVIAGTTKYVWEREREIMFNRYDYGALDRSLQILRAHNDRLAAAVVSVYTHRLVEPSTSLEAAVEAGLRFIDRLMPDPIRAPGVATGATRRWERKYAA